MQCSIFMCQSLHDFDVFKLFCLADSEIIISSVQSVFVLVKKTRLMIKFNLRKFFGG